MAVDETVDSGSFVLSDASLYPLDIPVAHRQLRHLISSPQPNIIFYVSGNNVFRVDAASNERTHMCILPFQARCTASGEGWFCAGGDFKGQFAAIKLDPMYSRPPVPYLDLPVDLSCNTTGLQVAADPLKKVYLEHLGDQIVNSISIHRQSEDNGDLNGNVVAVLTNNDRTVRLFSLTWGLEQDIIGLEFAMNHATISPNRRVMVAVGDLHYAYFFTKALAAKAPPSIEHLNQSSGKTPANWWIIAMVKLDEQSQNAGCGYFTTAWSPSGHLCAVGSECGNISIFNAPELSRMGPWKVDLLQVVPSSRPGTAGGPGSIRTMCFSPEPWDLLAWSEDQGRVCVADIRSGLLVRQVLELDPTIKSLTIIKCTNIGTTFTYASVSRLTRYSDAARDPHNTSLPNQARDMLAHQRRQEHPFNVSEDVANETLSLGLTDNELQILAALRSSRTHGEARAGNRNRLPIPSYRINSDGLLVVRPFPTAPERTLSTITSNTTASGTVYSYSLVMPDDEGLIQEALLNRRPPPHVPWTSMIAPLTTNDARDSPTVPAIDTQISNTSTAPISAPHNAPHTSATPGPPRPSRMPLPPSDLAQYSLQNPQILEGVSMSPPPAPLAAVPAPATEPRRVNTSNTTGVENLSPHGPLMRSTPLDRHPHATNNDTDREETTIHRSSSALQEMESQRQRLRDRRRTEAVAAGASTTHTSRPVQSPNPRPGDGLTCGLRTTGLAFSSNGHILYAGSTEGIFRFSLNVQQRRFWPSMDIR